MTVNQFNYAQLAQTAKRDLMTYQENVRSHQASEALEGRKIDETVRHQLATESLTASANAEAARHNAAVEAEAIRHNAAAESLQQYANETARSHNTATEAQGWSNFTLEHNKFEEQRNKNERDWSIASRNATTAEQRANQDYYVGKTKIENEYELGKRNAATNERNADTNRMNAWNNFLNTGINAVSSMLTNSFAGVDTGMKLVGKLIK